MGDSMKESSFDIRKTLAGSSIQKRAISIPDVLNEAYAYAMPSSFSRDMRIGLGELTIPLISGTASIDERGKSIHIGDFVPRCGGPCITLRDFLAAEDATSRDVMRTTWYLSDIDRDYEAFNEERTAFYSKLISTGFPPLRAFRPDSAVLSCLSRSNPSPYCCRAPQV